MLLGPGAGGLGQLPGALTQAGEGGPHLRTSAKAAWGVFAGRPLRAPSMCPGAWALVCPGVGEPLPAARRAPGAARQQGTLHPTGGQPAAQVLSHDILTVGHRREPADPPAAWPRVTEITHKSQRFVQTHPPPASEDKRSEAGQARDAESGEDWDCRRGSPKAEAGRRGTLPRQRPAGT